MAEALATVLLLIACAIAGWLGMRWRIRQVRVRPRHLDTIVVNTRRPDDQSIRGLFYEQSSTAIVLTQPYVLRADGSWQALAGKVVIPARSVSWLQKLSAAPATEPGGPKV